MSLHQTFDKDSYFDIINDILLGVKLVQYEQRAYASRFGSAKNKQSVLTPVSHSYEAKIDQSGIIITEPNSNTMPVLVLNSFGQKISFDRDT